MKKLFVLIILTFFAFVSAEVKAAGTDPPKMHQTYVTVNSDITADFSFSVFTADNNFGIEIMPVTKFLTPESVLYGNNAENIIKNSPPFALLNSKKRRLIIITTNYLNQNCQIAGLSVLFQKNIRQTKFLSNYYNRYNRQRYEYRYTEKGIYLCNSRNIFII